MLCNIVSWSIFFKKTNGFVVVIGQNIAFVCVFPDGNICSATVISKNVVKLTPKSNVTEWSEWLTYE